MTCIKTGTDVYFLAHGSLARCDVFQIGTSYVFRWNTNVEYTLRESVPEGTWVVDDRFDEDCWHREDLGVTVASSVAIIQHGERC